MDMKNFQEKLEHYLTQKFLLDAEADDISEEIDEIYGDRYGWDYKTGDYYPANFQPQT